MRTKSTEANRAEEDRDEITFELDHQNSAEPTIEEINK